MSDSPTHNKCPYTLKPLSECGEIDDEHIIPDSLGGVKDYCVKVSKKANSDLGSKIDAPLVSSMLIGAKRLQHGIRSRTGRLEWRLRGKTKDTERDVDITFTENGSCDVRFRKPVETDGDSVKLIVTPDARDALLRAFIEGHKRKGRTAQVAAESLSLVESIEVPIEVDILALKRAMIKIAYIAAYELLGDEFLDDPLMPEWRKAFLADDNAGVRDAKIHGVAFDTRDLLDRVLPELQPWEHAISIANLQMQGPVVCVTLFGKEFHSLILIASETSQFGLGVGEGKIAICDTKAGQTRFVDFREHLESSSVQMPGIDIPGA